MYVRTVQLPSSSTSDVYLVSSMVCIDACILHIGVTRILNRKAEIKQYCRFWKELFASFKIFIQVQVQVYKFNTYLFSSFRFNSKSKYSMLGVWVFLYVPMCPHNSHRLWLSNNQEWYYIRLLLSHLSISLKKLSNEYKLFFHKSDIHSV